MAIACSVCKDTRYINGIQGTVFPCDRCAMNISRATCVCGWEFMHGGEVPAHKHCVDPIEELTEWVESELEKLHDTNSKIPFFNIALPSIKAAPLINLSMR